MIVLAAAPVPDVVNALFAGCVAGGFVVGAVIALVNSWRV